MLCALVAAAQAGLLVAVGCSPPADAPDGAADVTLSWTIDPQPAHTGPVRLALELTDAVGAPVSGATLALEAGMSHPGMKSQFATATEAAPGHYDAAFEFTMGGDWFVLLDGHLADGRALQRRINVRGVSGR